MRQEVHSVVLFDQNRICVRIRNAGPRAPAQYAEADRREVDPPIEVETATWSAGGTLDWWVKERREWFGRVRGKDGRQRWIRATDLRPREGC
jgi:hypothetical protein